MKNHISSLFRLAIVTLAAFPALAFAAPTAGPYVSDPQNEYVHDATSDSISSVNQILCILDAMNINGSNMLNKGPYIALVDMNNCKSSDNSSSSSDSSGASAAANYSTAKINATRGTSSTDPMLANIWMSMNDQGKQMSISIRLTASKSPVEVPPYGVFRLDYIGKDNLGVTQFNGYIDSTSGNLKYFESSSRPEDNAAMSLTPGIDTSSGSGTLSKGTSPSITHNFNYNSANFRRGDLSGDPTKDRCFSRLKTDADKSVWRYGTYKDSDGSRVDQANPGFPITGTYANGTHYGYASYYGLGFQGLDLNTIPDANPIANLVITDQRPGNATTYNLSKVGGKLTKWTRNATTLAAMDGIPFSFYANLTGLTTGNTAVTGSAQWQMQWNNTAANFTVTGSQTCGTNGCALTAINPVAIVNTGVLNSFPINGWSESFGGSISIPFTGAEHIGSDAVQYFSQSTVTPGSASAPAALYCLSNCPDVASVTATTTGYVSGTVSPFNSITASQWYFAPTSTTGTRISYSFNNTGLNISSTPMIINNSAYYASNSKYQWGVMTGRLFDVDFLPCTVNMVVGVCEPSDPTSYYTWSTGTGQWNQSMWLTKTSDSSVVPFDPPQNVAYTVPANGTSWAGKQIQLQFNGFGNLYGIPGYCVSPVDNSLADCSANTRYVPMFSIPDAATMTLNGNLLIVKALDAELRLKDLGAGASTLACSGLGLSTLALPTGGAHDMTNLADAYYIGPEPLVTGTPKVIDGIVQ